eukprot:scaffold14137_cov87-Cylindrotheca_fusiformis.AAC.2
MHGVSTFKCWEGRKQTIVSESSISMCHSDDKVHQLKLQEESKQQLTINPILDTMLPLLVKKVAERRPLFLKSQLMVDRRVKIGKKKTPQLANSLVLRQQPLR